MADWKSWLRRAGQYGKDAMGAYGGDDQSTLGQGLAERARMQDVGNAAIQGGPDVPRGMMSPVAAPVNFNPTPTATPSLAPYEQVSPGFQPIGGREALRQTLAGQPPDLRRR